MDEAITELLAEFRGTLRDRDLLLFDQRLCADAPLTLQQLADQFGTSREDVRRLEIDLSERRDG